VLADILTELLGDPVRLESMGRAAREHVGANYNWDETVRRMHDRIARDLAARS
jgi:hypothetical protein